jgi:MscS family membrane protein
MQLMRAAFAGVVFWLAISAVDAVRASLSDDAHGHPGRRALLGLGGRLFKMVMVLVGVVVIMAELGFSVTSLVAGIGVGGLGLALAAQKTVENVFGAFSLGVDQPFREGDTITVDTVTGTVERIGLRSTRIRTLDRTLVAIPNGKLAEMRTETLTARDRFRLRSVLALRPTTSAATVRKLCGDIEDLLRAHPKVSIDVQARVLNLTPAAIEVEVIASFLTTNGDEWTRIRQDVLLGLLDKVEAAGTSLVPGAQSIEIVKAPSLTAT